MNLTNTTRVILSPGEIVQLLKLAYPKDIRLMSLPSNGSGVYLSLRNEGKALDVSFERRANTPEGVVKITKPDAISE